MSSSAMDVEDPDPIKASYDVYIRPNLDNGRQLYILQFPNREQHKKYNSAHNMLPTELRMKQKSGLLELDVPIDAWNNYDREKGLKWGDAIKKTSGNGAVSHGLPGGFGIGGTGIRQRGGGGDDEMDLQEQIMRDFAGAVTNQRVLTKQTLGGMTVPKEETSPQYMVGTFKKGTLHLTPVDQMVQLRPQFHHIDAASELERQSRARDQGVAAQRTAGEARAIHMTVKSIGDEEDSSDTMAERIRAAQDEKWRKMNYVDEDHEDAWHTFEEDLFVRGFPGDGEPEDEVYIPKLVSGMKDPEYLDAISAPRDAAKLSRSRGNRKGKDRDGEGGDSATMSEASSESESEA